MKGSNNEQVTIEVEVSILLIKFSPAGVVLLQTYVLNQGHRRNI